MRGCKLNLSIGGCLIGAIAGLIGLWAVGLRVNLTPSYPLGIWRIQKGVRPKKGDFVLFHFPPDNALYPMARTRGYLRKGAWGFAPLVKKLAAIPGDEVAITDRVKINGHPWQNGAIRTHDSQGRPIRSLAQSGVVADGDCWVLSDYNPRTFDSRYFGPIHFSSILATVRPILVWDGVF